MVRELPILFVVDELHVSRDVPFRLEGMAGGAPHHHALPRLRSLASGNMPEVGEDVAVLAERTHASMFRHLPFAREQAAAVGTIVLQHKINSSLKTITNVTFIT